LLHAGAARAHWCDDVWGSSYNITVKPETDSVDVPASGSADLVVYVQNNMGYPLVNFNLDAEISGEYTVQVTRQVPTLASYLLPEEKVQYTLTISRDGGATVSVEDITFYISFGEGAQSGYYGLDGEPVMIRKTDGSLFPDPPYGLGEGYSEALHLRYSAVANYGTLDEALDGLLQEYCAGRRSWDHTSTANRPGYCDDTTSTTCSSDSLSTPTKYDVERRWSAYELAYRKDVLGARAAVFRDRLECAWDDDLLSFKTFAGFVLGYLGEDAGARAFLEGIIASGSTDEQTIAKAALLLFRDPNDASAYHADVVSGLGSATPEVRNACAAALGIVDADDAAVTDYLLPDVRWECPSACSETDEAGFLPAHLLGLVVWQRRIWAPGAGDTGTVSFYGETDDPSSNDPPSCASATVTPTDGEVPLQISMDASGCTDPEGNNLSYSWRVPTSVTTEATYDTATAEHTITEPRNYTITLVVTDDGTPNMETSRQFFVTALPEGGGSGADDVLSGSCGCRSTRSESWPGALLLIAVAAFALRRRRFPAPDKSRFCAGKAAR